MTTKDNCELIQVTKPQRNFIDYCKEFGWGTVEVTIKDGQPVMVSPIKPVKKLD